MTRDFKDSHARFLKAEQKDRHLPKNGMRDSRGPIKKQGAGRGNWGTLTDEVNDLEHEETAGLVIDHKEVDKEVPNSDVYAAKVRTMTREEAAKLLQQGEEEGGEDLAAEQEIKEDEGTKEED